MDRLPYDPYVPPSVPAPKGPVRRDGAYWITTVVAICTFAAFGVCALALCGFFAEGALLDSRSPAAPVYLALAVPWTFASAIGLLARRRWALYATVVYFLFHTLVLGLGVAVGEVNALFLLVPGGPVVALLLPSVRQHVERGSGGERRRG
jgi:hypothetical protein